MQLHVKIFVFGLLACPSALMQAAESDNSAAAWTFSQCLDYAYSNNISLQRLVLDNQSDDATLEQSKAQWQPTLGFSTTQGYINYASPSENQTANVYSGVSRNLVGINFRHPNVMPNFAVWKTITYRHWHRWCCQPRF